MYIIYIFICFGVFAAFFYFTDDVRCRRSRIYTNILYTTDTHEKASQVFVFYKC